MTSQLKGLAYQTLFHLFPWTALASLCGCSQRITQLHSDLHNPKEACLASRILAPQVPMATKPYPSNTVVLRRAFLPILALRPSWVGRRVDVWRTTIHVFCLLPFPSPQPLEVSPAWSACLVQQWHSHFPYSSHQKAGRVLELPTASNSLFLLSSLCSPFILLWIVLRFHFPMVLADWTFQDTLVSNFSLNAQFLPPSSVPQFTPVEHFHEPAYCLPNPCEERYY